jgi:hypothetical protein
MSGKNSAGSDMSNINEYNEKHNSISKGGGPEGKKHSSAKKRKVTAAATPPKSQKKAASNTMPNKGKKKFLEDLSIVLGVHFRLPF